MHVLMHGNVIMYVYLIKSKPIFIMWAFGYYLCILHDWCMSIVVGKCLDMHEILCVGVCN